MAWVHFNYDTIMSRFPLFGIFSKEVLLVIQFLTGFLQFPIMFCLWVCAIPLVIKNYILNRKANKLNERYRKAYEKYKDCFVNAEGINDEDVLIGEYQEKPIWYFKENLAGYIEDDKGKILRKPKCYYGLKKGRNYRWCSSDVIESKVNEEWEIIYTFNNPYYKQNND